MSRATCPRCRRPAPRCLCALLEPIHTRTGVTILQHPGERRHAFNTARLAQQVLERCTLRITWPNPQGQLRLEPDLPPDTVLLYPSDEATDLAELAHPPSHLLVIDGTWSQARKLVGDNPWLRRLPAVRIQPEQPSRYLIRAEPAPHCLSTIESIEIMLRTLEPENPALPRLLDGFLEMVRRQAEDRPDLKGSP